MNGIVILDKPLGLSSNQAMGRLKRLLEEKKAGFLGTLDPLASGVLPVFLGKATKLIPFFEGVEKEYRVTVKLGETTETLDAEGAVQEVRDTGGLTETQVEEVVLSFDGKMIQRTPSFSAVKINGVPAYKLARKGAEVPTRDREVELSHMTIEKIDLPEVTFTVVCSAGTYMRALAAEIGEKLAVGGHVKHLRRTRCGRLFTEEISSTLEEITYALERETLDFLKNPGDFLADHSSVVLPEEMEGRLRDGQPLTFPVVTCEAAKDKIKVMRSNGELLATGKVVRRSPEAVVVQPKKVFL